MLLAPLINRRNIQANLYTTARIAQFLSEEERVEGARRDLVHQGCEYLTPNVIVHKVVCQELGGFLEVSNKVRRCNR